MNEGIDEGLLMYLEHTEGLLKGDCLGVDQSCFTSFGVLNYPVAF